MKHNLNSDGTFMNEDEICEDVKNRIDDETRKLLTCDFKPILTKEERSNMMQTGFNPYHFARYEFGRWIRNSYGLWDENNPYVILNPEPNEYGIIDNPLFPDNLAGHIIDRLVKEFG